MNEPGEEERILILAWYEDRLKSEEPFDNMRVLIKYCEDDIRVLRQACRYFKREIMHIGNVEIFLDSISIDSVCNKILLKRFLQRDSIGLILNEGNACNNKYSKKALKWLMHMEKTDGVKIKHGRNGRV